MNITRISLTCALGALIAWALKGIAIGVAGGLDRSPWETPLFFLGLALSLATAVSLGLALAAGQHPAVRLATGLLAVAAPVAAAGLLGAVVQSFATSDHWAWSEVELWLLATALVCFAWWADRGKTSASGRRALVEDLA